MLNWLSNENVITVLNDIEPSEVSTKEVDTNTGNDTTELQILTEIRDVEKEQLSYISFFVIIVLGGVVVYRLIKFLQSFIW